MQAKKKNFLQTITSWQLVHVLSYATVSGTTNPVSNNCFRIAIKNSWASCCLPGAMLGKNGNAASFNHNAHH